MIIVAPAAPSDVGAAAVVLAEAFADDPVTAPLVGGGEPADRQARLEHLFVALLRPAVADATVDLARHPGDPDVLGVAIWEAPGTVTSVVQLAAQLPSFARACGIGGLLRAASTKHAIDRHRPRSPHWYLQEVGVAARARGAGVGTALLRSRLAVVDAQDAAAHLESSTEQNRRLYRRHGFVDVGPVRGLASPPMVMSRPPASRRAGAGAAASRSATV
ncbi:GNAT family N-acetyltransferase [Cellulomonas sp. zg-ZUI22]|uniref:GNAT family N-acetyltransferase n=1 Tax=Cellulomonas sp. zg-ZUI22 TaxID=2816955 RepID=UPI001A94CAE6|nr:GNAT family N-acetyltransferase [Cellulomonas sp. zg-ZUI22]MBO0898547.1 GNAT family N-acetyltransferase [Cellulomonas sp. zg-ZUI22]